MYEAASVISIRKRLKTELPRKVLVTRREPVPEIGLMTPQSMNRPLRYQTVRVRKGTDLFSEWKYKINLSPFLVDKHIESIVDLSLWEEEL